MMLMMRQLGDMYGAGAAAYICIISIKKDNFCGDGADKTAVSSLTCFYAMPLVVLVQGMFWLNGSKCKCRCYHGVLHNDNDEIGWTESVCTRRGFPLAKIQPSLSSTSVSFDVPFQAILTSDSVTTSIEDKKTKRHGTKDKRQKTKDKRQKDKRQKTKRFGGWGLGWGFGLGFWVGVWVEVLCWGFGLGFWVRVLS